MRERRRRLRRSRARLEAKMVRSSATIEMARRIERRHSSREEELEEGER
jgi:hypothetical protein